MGMRVKSLRGACLALLMLWGVLTASAGQYGRSSSVGGDGFFSLILNGNILNAITNTDDNKMEDARKTAPPLGIRYTKKHPLIIVGDWAFRPYAFINDNGQPDGFQVELLKEIFNRMHVPYEIHLMDWHQAKTEVQTGRAQVMIDIEKNDVMPGVVYGKEVLAEYKIGVMRRRETLQLRSIQFLMPSDTVYCYENDYAERWLSMHLSEVNRNGHSCVIKTINPYLTFGDLSSGNIKYYIWGKYALRNVERLYDSDNHFEIDDIDVPAGKFRFYASDTLLVAELDAQFRRLVESGFYDAIHDRWLSDTENSNVGYTAIDIALIIFLLTLVVIFIFVAVVMQRDISVSTLRREFSTLIDNSEDISSCQIWVINTSTQWISNLAGNFLPPKGLSVSDYEQLIHPDDAHLAISARLEVDEGRTVMPVVRFRMRPYDSPTGEWRNVAVHARIVTNGRGKVKNVNMCVLDETQQMRETEKLNRLINESASITSITDLGLLYYDAAGNFVSANNMMIRILSRGRQGNPLGYLRSRTLQQFLITHCSMLPDADMNVWMCTHFNIPELGIHLPVELRICGIVGKDGESFGYSINVRDLSDIANIHSTLRKGITEYNTEQQKLQNLQNEIHRMLRMGSMLTFRWRKGSDFIEKSSDLFNFDNPVPVGDYKEVFSKEEGPRSMVVQETDGNWLEVHYTPDYDELGHHIGVFGVAIDITPFKKVEQELREQTEKANDSGRQKTVFMANMTHELRTPLNAVNGFAEILKLTYTPEEKQQYVDIMMHSCTMLIAMVDNILQLSMIDTDGIKLHKRQVDFSVLFELRANEMRRFISTPNVDLQIVSPEDHLVLTLDSDRVIQVLEIFANNASKFTNNGHIRLGYAYEDGWLTVYCEDTGCGIPADKQEEIFNRFVKLNDFVQGTGLGLSVAQAIAQAMNATISLTSEEGKGSTFSMKLRVEN